MRLLRGGRARPRPQELPFRDEIRSEKVLQEITNPGRKRESGEDSF
jgi:hypothetical protein